MKLEQLVLDVVGARLQLHHLLQSLRLEVLGALLELAVEVDVAIKVLGGLGKHFLHLCHIVIVVLISLLDEAFRAEVFVAIFAVKVKLVLWVV